MNISHPEATSSKPTRIAVPREVTSVNASTTVIVPAGIKVFKL
jgi:hypothetical protein